MKSLSISSEFYLFVLCPLSVSRVRSFCWRLQWMVCVCVCFMKGSLFELPVWLESVVLAWDLGSAGPLETQAFSLGDKILLNSIFSALSSELATRALTLSLSLPLEVGVGGHGPRSLLPRRRCLGHHLSSSRLLQVEAYLVSFLRVVLLGEDWHWGRLRDAITGDRRCQKDFRLNGCLVVISRFELLPWLVLIIFTTRSWGCFTTFLYALGVEVVFAFLLLLLMVISLFFRWRHLVVGKIRVENWLGVVLRVAWDAQNWLSFNCGSGLTVPGRVASVRLSRIEMLWALSKLVNVPLLLSRRHIGRSGKLRDRISQLARCLANLIVMHV